MRRIHRFALLFAAVAITGCTSVPFDYPKEPSVAFAPSSDSRIARDTEAWVYANDGSSGFVPLTDGMDALGARLRMMEQAQISIDAQYFLIKPDTAGALFAAELLEAADRGVKVRFLIDDIFTPNLDQQLGALDAHPNIEVRLFNPLSRQSFRAWSLLTDFKRANRRMHNKAFIVDNSVTIVGGRNIAAEYFQIDDDVEFVDFEIVGFGPVARKVSNTFDIFWNSEFSVPVSAFVDEPAPEDLLNLRDRLPPELVEATLTVYNEALTTQYLQDINDGVIVPVAARARVVTDLPNKLTTSTRDSEAKELAAVLREHGDDAEREIIIVTPYFVPGDTLANTLLAYVNQGIRVVVVTNSLASTNHVPVHSGYARYRKRLVEAGVEIYELKRDAIIVLDGGEEMDISATLHTKVVIFDRETLFVGSLNLDPRSIDINTEMGLFINSVELAEEFAEELHQDLSFSTYRVILEEGKIRWLYAHEGESELLTKEPQAGFWRRFSSGFYRILPIEGQL